MAAIAPSTTCSVALPAETYKDLLEFLAEGGDDSLSSVEGFVDEAVRERIFRASVRQIKAANLGVSEEEMMVTIDEALEWARARR